MRLNGFRSVPRREPLPLPPPYVGNINKVEQLSQLESESLNTGRQPSYAAGGGGKEGGQLPGEGNVDTVFPARKSSAVPTFMETKIQEGGGEMRQCRENEAGDAESRSTSVSASGGRCHLMGNVLLMRSGLRWKLSTLTPRAA